MYYKRFEPVEIIEQYTDLSRRVLRFSISESIVVLDYDADEERATTRHKWRPVSFWQRQRSYQSTRARKHIEYDTQQRALNAFRYQIEYEKEPAK